MLKLRATATEHDYVTHDFFVAELIGIAVDCALFILICFVFSKRVCRDRFHSLAPLKNILQDRKYSHSKVYYILDLIFEDLGSFFSPPPQYRTGHIQLI